MQIALNGSLEEAVRRRALEGGYKSADEYVQAVVLADLNHADAGLGAYPELSPETRAAIQRGLESWPGIVADDACWEAKSRRIQGPRAGA